MTTTHPAPADLEAFARGRHAELPKAGRIAVLRHLLAGCLPCQERIAALAPLPRHGRQIPPSLKEGAEYDAAFDRATQLAYAGVQILLEEKERAPAALAAQLERRDGWEEDSPRDWQRRPALALCELLMEKSFALRHQSPGAMVHLARLAKVAADNLDPERYGAALVADVQARAVAELSNALRVADQLKEAEMLLCRSAALLEHGTGDPLLLARVAVLFASLFNSQRNFAQALEMLDRAHWLYLKMGDKHLAGRALVKKGIYSDFRGDVQAAVALLHRGLELLDPARDPKLAISAQQNLLGCMIDLGQYSEARRFLFASGLRKDLAGDALNLVKLRWLEGRIASGLGQLPAAEATFTEARAGFAAAKQVYNAALVGLDLCGVWLRQDRTAEILALVDQMLATFGALGIAREAIGAVALVREACAREALTAELLDSARSLLKRLEREPAPALPF